MANTVIEIWNMALAAAGSSTTISSESESSAQANNCRVHYDEVRKFVLRQAPWGCALTWARLPVIKERDFSLQWEGTDPAPGYRFAYGIPAAFVCPYYLMDYGQYELGLYNGVTPAIMANSEVAVLRYVRDQTQVSLWDAGLTNAIVNTLAYKLAPTVNAKVGMLDRAREYAKEAILNAQTEAANRQESHMVEALPEGIQARGYGGGINVPQYFFSFPTFNGDML